MIYRCSDGELLRQLKGHKDHVYTVCYSRSGDRLASGGADKCTVIWSKVGKGILKFSHTTSVQVVAYNPVEDILASCAVADYGFWSAEGKGVKKHKVASKIMCVAWRPDGQILAIGNLSGEISLRDLHGNDRGIISRSGPISALTWSQFDFDAGNKNTTLIVGSWDQTIAFFDASLEVLTSEYEVDGYPLSISLYGSMDQYILVSSNEHTLYIYNHKGIVVSTLTLDLDWVWYAKGHGNEGQIACKDCTGELRMLDVKNRVLSCERNGMIAHSLGGTRAVVYNVERNYSIPVDGKDAILGLDIGRTHFAVHVKSDILVYAISDESTTSYKQNYTHQIQRPFDKFALVASQLLMAYNERLCLHNRQGSIIKTWTFLSKIACIRVTCDILGCECALVGCMNGSVMEVALGNAFPVEIFKLKVGMKTLVASCNRSFVAVIDKADQLQIYNRIEEGFERRKSGLVTKVIFNDCVEGLYCYHSNGTVIIQDSSSMTKVLDCKGTVVKFSGSKLITLHRERICHKTVDLAPLIEHKIEKESYGPALSIAKLGVGTLVWENLGYQSMLGLNLNVAESCFSYLGEGTKVSMVRRLNETLDQFGNKLTRDSSIQLIASKIDIINGNFEIAGSRLVLIGEITRAVDMFVSMGMFEDAKKAIPNEDIEQRNRVAMKEAEWEEGMHRWKRASELYIECKAFVRAVDVASNIGGEQGLEQIHRIATVTPVDERVALDLCCDYLAQQAGNEVRLKEILTKMGDYSKLMALYIDLQAWLEVSNLRKEQEGNFDKTLLVPYANWLAVQGNLKEALEVNREAAREDRNFKLLSYLIKEARTQQCYKKVSELYFIATTMAINSSNAECLKVWFTDDPDLGIHEMKRLAVLFHVYEQVIDYSVGIFSASLPHNILQGCLFLINSVRRSKVPKGISMTRLIMIFCKLARNLGGYLSTRIGYDLLSTESSISEQHREKLADDMMTIEVSS